MSATCGPPSRTPLAFYDPDGCCWRTSQGTFPWDSTPSSPTLPRWGMTRRGALYELPTPALPTTELACSSLLPTPNASVSQDGEHPETWEAHRQVALAKGYNGNGIGMPLTIAVQLLPTPTRSDANGAGAHGDGGDDLRTTLSLLPTPRALGQRTSRYAATAAYRRSAPSLEQAMEIAQGIMPRELRSWDEAQQSWLPTGGTTSPPSVGGSTSSNGQPLDQLSLDEPESA